MFRLWGNWNRENIHVFNLNICRITGENNRSGLLGCTLREIFKSINEKTSVTNYQVKFSYIELYNEVIRDMIGRDTTSSLELREDPEKGLIVVGLNEEMVSCTESIVRMIGNGNKNRMQNPMGQYSSRSHGIYTTVKWECFSFIFCLWNFVIFLHSYECVIMGRMCIMLSSVYHSHLSDMTEIIRRSP